MPKLFFMRQAFYGFSATILLLILIAYSRALYDYGAPDASVLAFVLSGVTIGIGAAAFKGASKTVQEQALFALGTRMPRFPILLFYGLMSVAFAVSALAEFVVLKFFPEELPPFGAFGAAALAYLAAGLGLDFLAHRARKAGFLAPEPP